MQLSARRTTASHDGIPAEEKAGIIMTMDAMLEQCMAVPNQTEDVKRSVSLLSNALDSDEPVRYLRRLAQEHSAKGREARNLCNEAGIPRPKVAR